ncbi:glyoxalase/bleomycin resistance/dioxygenase family protein [Allopusillimonas soli]|uniref:Glyoxalase/bleomycin resistance/dioxygenase family protein n=1 Tax=Allopusillimonas soli TaxID=659016 RepID=A0A853F9E5_9BURK|nr:ArsI/CadI family heavy metal resistance metalloenzyme [Allopusillimonas soli]NYT36418.1 glyoxalase/bleomycin resistance/dioxygenase family protein [Allopusillimonas soli]TEA74929.1 glyoxalase/bleomycin resistance/dioxygenase family protein [Allopusillimonas soli]
MKRFHVHLHVDDLAKNTDFYSQLFAQAPMRIESDYAKWMLDDPPVNFAISTRGTGHGVDHFGIQAEDAVELNALKDRAQAARLALEDQGETACCYARSEKYWITDPQGLAWEHFHTLGSIPIYGESRDGQATPEGKACCSPASSPTTRCC